MKLITLLTAQMGGQLDIHRSNPTRFILHIPLPLKKEKGTLF
jgi:hypothetical protein